MTAIPTGRLGHLRALVGPGLLLAALLNGLGTHLKLIGVWDKAGYETYWELHCPDGVTTSAPVGVGRRCEVPDLSSPPRIPHRQGAEYALHVSPPGVWLKRAKDGFALVLVALCLACKPRSGWAAIRGLSPSAILLTLVAVGAALGIAAQGDGLALAVGARSFLFLAIALTSAGFIAAEGLSTVALWVAILLMAQLLFVPSQFLFGIPVNGYLPFLHLPRRMAGTFTFPNSLGVFAVVGFAFVSAYLPQRRRWPLLLSVCVALVWLSGSATGVVALLWWVAAAIFRSAPKRSRVRVVLVSALVASVVLAMLPPLLGRQTIFKGVFGPGGRVVSLTRVLTVMDGSRVIFGEGLGRGTNALASLSGVRSLGAGDSTVTTLVRQTGLLGCAAFYLLLAWAWRRDPLARPFYEVLALVSLTLAVTELFPANVLLGLALGRSLWHTPPRWPNDESA